MTRDRLTELLDRNDAHVAALDRGAFADKRDVQRPPVVSVCCSDSRVSQEGMWSVDGPGYLFTAGNIGNRVIDVTEDGERVLEGSAAYPLGHTETNVLAVVGHTGCGAVGAALHAVETGEYPAEAGVRADVEELVPIVEEGTTDPAVVEGDADTTLRNRLVEYNVHEQVSFATGDPDAAGADVYGFVYDFHGAYGERDGAAYLVNANGDRDPDSLRELVGPDRTDHVGTLLAGE
ncbi:carbonic anhydrase [Halorubrum tibetense]|uniref:carbonic anhydrase n=1 Tax=Halorubrum tibetense TaxID=175631 RepID=A0ABD5SF60_9EURY